MIEIPKSLIKEVINQNPYYYKNYQKVLFDNQSLESIVGKSRFQALIISSIMIWGGSFRENYRVLGNLRLNLDETDFVILPLAFYKKSELPPEKFDNHYFTEVPVLVFEIDVSIDISKEEEQNYVFEKTEKLLEFGTEKVIWIFTKNRKIIVAEPNKSWTIDNWNKTIEVLNEPFVLDIFLREEEIIR